MHALVLAVLLALLCFVCVCVCVCILYALCLSTNTHTNIHTQHSKADVDAVEVIAFVKRKVNVIIFFSFVVVILNSEGGEHLVVF